MAPSAACECGAEEQTAGHVVLQCPIHRPHGLHGLTVLDNETTEWLSWPDIIGNGNRGAHAPYFNPRPSLVPSSVAQNEAEEAMAHP